MAADSTASGYLRPTPPGPLYDDDLEDFFQAFVVGLTGFPGNLVRPRWQPDPPNLPSDDVDWIALGVAIVDRQWNSFQKFHADIGPEGTYISEGNEVMEVFLSFYGPSHSAKRREFEDGLQISQNLDPLFAQRIKYIECRMPVSVPAILKNRWFMRSDIKVVFHRWVERVYPIKTFTSATVDINDEKHITHVSVTP